MSAVILLVLVAFESIFTVAGTVCGALELIAAAAVVAFAGDSNLLFNMLLVFTPNATTGGPDSSK